MGTRVRELGAALASDGQHADLREVRRLERAHRLREQRRQDGLVDQASHGLVRAERRDLLPALGRCRGLLDRGLRGAGHPVRQRPLDDEESVVVELPLLCLRARRESARGHESEPLKGVRSSSARTSVSFVAPGSIVMRPYSSIGGPPSTGVRGGSILVPIELDDVCR